jgi:hypothetical protein
MSNASRTFSDNQLIPITEGRARVKDLDINWTSATEVNKTYAFGDDIVDPVTDQPTRLPGKPSYDSLTLTSPRTKSAVRKLETWLKSQSASPYNVAVTLISAGVYYTYTNCSISRQPVSPNIDANANATTASFLTLVIEVSNYSKIEVRSDQAPA